MNWQLTYLQAVTDEVVGFRVVISKEFSRCRRIQAQDRLLEMAQATCKLKGFIGIIRCGIQRHSRDLFSSPNVFESSHISHANLKAFSCSLSSRGLSPLEQLGNVKNSCSARYLLVSNVERGIGGARAISFPAQGGLKILATRELSGYRSAHHRVMQEIGFGSKLQRRIWSSHSKVQHELNLPIKGSGGVFRGRRTYYVDREGIQHFRRRGPASWSEKFATQRHMGILLVLVGGGLVLYVTNLQVVPYTHRKHFVLISPRLERSIGDQTYEMIMKQYKGRLLPPNHPQSVRVHKIADQIIEALMVGVEASDWSKLDNGSVDIIDTSKGWDRDSHSKTLEKPLLEPYGSHTHRDDETLDEMFVDKSRQHGLETGQHGYTKHLEGMKWKVVVVDDEIVNAICIPGGKIVVFTGLLKKFRSDPEVATVVAHEIGHAVARHSAEGLTHNLFIVALQLIVLSVFYVPQLVNSVSEILLRLPFSRRMEIEADHVGLILMAAAGYDPRLAPGFYEKLGKLENTADYAQYLSTHPSGKRRGELLNKTATMQEAVAIYQKKMSGQGTEGFF